MAKKYIPIKLQGVLKYEVDMLNETYNLIPEIESLLLNPRHHQRWAANNALKESFCVHARSLIEFFATKSHENGAHTFCNGFEPETIHLVRKLNNQISHLMDNRTEDDSKKINDADRAEIMQFIAGKLSEFKKCLTDDYSGIEIPSVELRVHASGSGATNQNSSVSSTIPALGVRADMTTTSSKLQN